MDKFAELPGDAVAAQVLLQRYLDEALTAICLVIGKGGDADECWQKAKRQATDVDSRVVRVGDPSLLSAAQRAAWQPQPAVLAAFLTPEQPRRVSSTLGPPAALSGVRLSSAFRAALAGRIAP